MQPQLQLLQLPRQLQEPKRRLSSNCGVQFLDNCCSCCHENKNNSPVLAQRPTPRAQSQLGTEPTQRGPSRSSRTSTVSRRSTPPPAQRDRGTTTKGLGTALGLASKRGHPASVSCSSCSSCSWAAVVFRQRPPQRRHSSILCLTPP